MQDPIQERQERGDQRRILPHLEIVQDKCCTQGYSEYVYLVLVAFECMVDDLEDGMFGGCILIAARETTNAKYINLPCMQM